MNKKLVALSLRVLLGLIFLVFGLNGFLNFIPMPTTMPEPMMTFTKGMLAAKYFFPLLKGTEVICGALLLAGAYVPLALVILAPIVINIFCVHLVMAHSGLPFAAVIVILEVALAYLYRNAYAALLTCKSEL